MNDPNDYFYNLLLIDPIYETEDQYIAPFWEFKYRFQSLQRHWELNKVYLQHHISNLQTVTGDGTAEYDLAYSESASVDIEYFPEYLRLSTISFSLALVEQLIGSLCEEIAHDTGASIEFKKRQLPYINKYVNWLISSCGIDIDIEKKLWKNLDAIRELRNRFIHKIDRDIPEDIKKTIGEMVSEVGDDANLVTDEFVNKSLLQLATLVKKIEVAYIRYYNNQKK